MTLEFDKSFSKSLDKISNPFVKRKIDEIIFEVEKAHSMIEIRNLKKLKGYKNYYRIRIGDYRLGFEILTNFTIRFLIIAHRKDIYKIFP